MTPERRARQTIDSMLEAAGWHVQNHAGHNTAAALGVAVREYPLKADQRADYLLFINGAAVGVIEAKPEGTTLSGALQQAERYRASLPDNLRHFPNSRFPTRQQESRLVFEIFEILTLVHGRSLRFTHLIPSWSKVMN